MVFIAFFIFILHALLPILGYFQFKQQDLKNPELQKVRFSFKEMHHAKSDQPALQLIKWSFWAGIVALISILPLMGLPGGLLINVFQMFNLIPKEKLLGDFMWPLAILVSMMIPIAWPMAIAVRNALSSYWNLHWRYTVKFVIVIWFVLIFIVIKLLLLKFE